MPAYALVTALKDYWCVDIPCVSCLSQRTFPILLLEQLLVIVWYFDSLALEGPVPQRKHIISLGKISHNNVLNRYP